MYLRELSRTLRKKIKIDSKIVKQFCHCLKIKSIKAVEIMKFTLVLFGYVTQQAKVFYLCLLKLRLTSAIT